MKKLFLLIAAFCCALTVSAQAQYSKPILESQLPQYFPDNVTNYIAPALLRGFLTNAINSWQQYAGVNAQTGTSYTVQASDYGQYVSFKNNAAIAVTLPAATAAGGFYPFSFYASDVGSGTATLTPQSGTIGGSATWTLTTGQSILIIADGTNWQVVTFSGGGGGGGTTLTVGSTPIIGGAANNLLADNGGTLIELTALPNGTTATTQTSSDASTKVATDQYVQNALVGAGLVTSVFGRAGAVVAESGDYTFSQIGSTPTTVSGYGITNALVTTNNLSDLTSASTARTNLGLGTFATQNYTTPPAIGGVTPAAGTFTSLTASTSLTSSTTANFIGTFQFAGNTMTFPGSPATLAFQVGTFTPGDCLQIAAAGSGGAVGGLADSGNPCGSGGGGGGGSTAHTQDFLASVNFTPGTTTTLTLSSLPNSAAALEIYFDGITQNHNTWSVNLTSGVVTFDAAIPNSVQVVEAQWLATSLTSGTVTTVSVVSANGFAGTVASPTTTPAITLSTTVTGILQGNGAAISAASTSGSGNVVLASAPSIASPTFTGTVGGSNVIPLTVLATVAANTVLGNWSASTSNVVANSMPSCNDSGGNHLNYVSGTGITCGTGLGNSISALTGDVTATGPGSATATIASNAVTFAKFQQINSHTLLGNSTGSSGNVQALTLGSTLNFSSTTVNCTTATNSQLGCVEPDGTTITISGGVITASGGSATQITVGTTTVGSGTSGYCLYDNAGVLGAQSCGTATSIAIGSTSVSGGTSGYILYNNAGLLGNEAVVPQGNLPPFINAMATITAARFAGPMGFLIGAL